MGTVVEQGSSDLSSLRPSTSSGFSTWINLLARWLRPDMLTTAEAALVDELKRAARVLGAPLLDAESRDDLNDKIEHVILLPEFQHFDESAGKFIVIIGSTTLARLSDGPPVALVR